MRDRRQKTMRESRLRDRRKMIKRWPGLWFSGSNAHFSPRSARGGRSARAGRDHTRRRDTERFAASVASCSDSQRWRGDDEDRSRRISTVQHHCRLQTAPDASSSSRSRSATTSTRTRSRPPPRASGPARAATAAAPRPPRAATPRLPRTAGGAPPTMRATTHRTRPMMTRSRSVASVSSRCSRRSRARARRARRGSAAAAAARRGRTPSRCALTSRCSEHPRPLRASEQGRPPLTWRQAYFFLCRRLMMDET